MLDFGLAKAISIGEENTASADQDSFAPMNLSVVFNWFEELSETVPNGLGE